VRQQAESPRDGEHEDSHLASMKSSKARALHFSAPEASGGVCPAERELAMSELSPSPEPAGGLARLLVLEAQVASRVEAAHQEAERMIGEARAEAESAQSRLAEELAETSRELTERLASENLRALTAIEERAEIEAAELDSVDEVTLNRLALALFERLLEGATPRPPRN
jgi:vacuolar-type H+-ATPase subunit H